MDRSLVQATWQALSEGELAPMEALLAPDARWRAVEDGPWNCENRAAIIEVMGHNLHKGLAGRVEDVIEHGDRTIVAFRPAHHAPDAWPLDDGVRWVVLTTRDELVVEMKGCRDRHTAMAYAGLS